MTTGSAFATGGSGVPGGSDGDTASSSSDMIVIEDIKNYQVQYPETVIFAGQMLGTNQRLVTACGQTLQVRAWFGFG